MKSPTKPQEKIISFEGLSEHGSPRHPKRHQSGQVAGLGSRHTISDLDGEHDSDFQNDLVIY